MGGATRGVRRPAGARGPLPPAGPGGRCNLVWSEQDDQQDDDQDEKKDSATYVHTHVRSSSVAMGTPWFPDGPRLNPGQYETDMSPGTTLSTRRRFF
jgi:hypothetical protein